MDGEINEQTVRDTVYKSAKARLRGAMMVPYFMSQDPNILALPAITEL
jgi:hypothetical protein